MRKKNFEEMRFSFPFSEFYDTMKKSMVDKFDSLRQKQLLRIQAFDDANFEIGEEHGSLSPFGER